MNIIDKFRNWKKRNKWNKQYRKGKWDNLRNDTETPRYIQILDFINKYGSENSSILDLGSGEGVLTERINGYNYSFFKGIDYSDVSIAKAIAKNFSKSEFATADLHTFTPERAYDTIVFNEVFYYIHNTEKNNVINKMINSLNDNGIIITSIFREGTGCWEYFDEHEKLEQLDFTTVQSSKDDLYWKIGVYKKK